MNVLLFLACVILVAAMVKAVQNHKQGGEWGMPLALLCIVLSIPVMWLNFRSPPAVSQEALRREQSYQDALGLKLAAEINAQFPQGRVVLVSIPGAPSGALETLRRAITPSGRVTVATPDIEAEVRRLRAQIGNGEESEWADELEDMLRMEMHLSPEMLNRTLESLSGTMDVLVFMAPLPFEIESLAFWNFSPRPAVILASGQDIWNHDRLGDLLRNGFIHGLIAYNTDAWRTQGLPPADPEKAFAERYHWITLDTIGLLDTLQP
jgi:hypothetical protein